MTKADRHPRNSARTIIVWFRRDLRVADNPALNEAVESGAQVVPIFVWSDSDEEPWGAGEAQRWWIRKSLDSLGERLRELGLPLLIRSGSYAQVIGTLAMNVGADTLHVNRRYEPHAVSSDENIVRELARLGVAVKQFDSALLHDPDKIRTSSGGAYRVFTPFWNRLRNELLVPVPTAVPRVTEGESVDHLLVDDDAPSTAGSDLSEVVDLAASWQPGEVAAHNALGEFVNDNIQDYDERRNLLASAGTSRLSPYLANGELSSRQVWNAIAGASIDNADAHSEPFLRQLAWREFSYHVLVNNPRLASNPLNQRFEAFPWRHDAERLARWKDGCTGYPIVDAGMRQLSQTGWMHNRARMVVASFLTKHLLISWQEGASWFWQRLVDADLANNSMGWQWSAGCGADAQPFFRIFNPVTQGEKFDLDGTYVRRWVPELERMPTKYLHRPWAAGHAELVRSGVELGKTYPHPIVPHKDARIRALEAYEVVKASR